MSTEHLYPPSGRCTANLTTLAPEIIAAILDDTLPAHLTIHALGINTPLLWSEQRRIVEE